jgi:Zn-dependent alcohol dehydrogenase
MMHTWQKQEDLCETFFAYNRLKGSLYDGKTRLFRTDGTPIAMYSMAGLAEVSLVTTTRMGVSYKCEWVVMDCIVFGYSSDRCIWSTRFSEPC